MNIILGVVLIAVCLTIVIFTVIDSLIFGELISPNEVNQFLDKHFEEYRLNFFGSDILSNRKDSSMPYIAIMSPSLFSKYYIQDYGQIWRWSAATKRIDEKFKSFKKPSPKLNEL